MGIIQYCPNSFTYELTGEQVLLCHCICVVQVVFGILHERQFMPEVLNTVIVAHIDQAVA
jgi:hypothetical protein